MYTQFSLVFSKVSDTSESRALNIYKFSILAAASGSKRNVCLSEHNQPHFRIVNT